MGRIHKRLTELGLKLKQILVTHAPHRPRRRRAQAEAADRRADFPERKRPAAAEDDGRAGGVAGRAHTPETAPPDESLEEGQMVGLERYPAQVLHTPGHTQGSVCLHFAPLKLLVAGDTLFAGSIGRTDLPGGDFDQIIDSMRTRLLALPDETRVLPGHGPGTTIGEERRSNPFLQHATALKKRGRAGRIPQTLHGNLMRGKRFIFSYIDGLVQEMVLVVSPYCYF